MWGGIAKAVGTGCSPLPVPRESPRASSHSAGPPSLPREQPPTHADPRPRRRAAAALSQGRSLPARRVSAARKTPCPPPSSAWGHRFLHPILPPPASPRQAPAPPFRASCSLSTSMIRLGVSPPLLAAPLLQPPPPLPRAGNRAPAAAHHTHTRTHTHRPRAQQPSNMAPGPSPCAAPTARPPPPAAGREGGAVARGEAGPRGGAGRP